MRALVGCLTVILAGSVLFAAEGDDEKERLEREAGALRRETADAIADKLAAEEKLSVLLAERDSIQLKVEAMLDAITMIDDEVAEVVGR